MTIAQAREIHALLVDDRWVDAGNAVLALIGQSHISVKTKVQALTVCRNLFQFLLDNELYLHAATLQWGGEVFNAEPESVQRIFTALHGNAKILLQGASSMGKSYSAGAWMYLDWRRDPLYTSIKCVGVSEDQVRKHVFAHIVKLHRTCAITMSEDIVIRESDMWMGVKEAGNEFGITAIAYKQSQETSGGIKGYKSMPVRTKPHPKFGYYSRLRLLGDEGQNWPNGPFKDIQTWVSQIDGPERVKIAIAFNPESLSQLVVQMAEPDYGWTIDDIDTIFDWSGKSGWRVCRLDAMRSENVIQKKVIYHGLQTYEGYLGYLKSGGDSSANYFCADTDTEVLSSSGWKRHNQVCPGDSIYTINPSSGMAEWMPVREVFQKHYDGSLCAMEGRGFSALVTNNHRWAITEKGKIKRRNPSLRFKETRNLGNHDLIPLAAKYNHNLQDAGDADFGELLGWVISDGTLCRHKKVVIYQSGIANGHKCDRIRNLLVRLGCKFSELSRQDGIIEFGFSGDLADDVRYEVSSEKSLRMETILKLSQNGRVALMDGLILGDGGLQGGGTRYFCSSKESEASTFSALAALCGYSTTTKKRWIETKFKLKNGWVSPGCWMWYVNVRISKTTRVENMTVTNKPYNGIVWCPRTDNGTFYARRNGTTYFTGNTFARGFPPIVGTVNTIIPPSWPQSQRGEAVFIENPIVCAAVDLAFMGSDSAQMVVGRWGLASGWRDHQGKLTVFKDRLNIASEKPRHVLQIDQLLPLQKSDNTVTMAEEIMGKCKKLQIIPDFVGLDKTGYGFGVNSHLVKVWGEVFGIAWNEKATERKILAEDKEGANMQCDGVMSEMWWAFRRWLDPVCCAVLIHPIIPTHPIYTQLTSRRYKNGAKGIKVEPKEEYKSRNKHSPDEADAFVMLVHLIRKKSDIIPGTHEEQRPKKDSNTTSGIKFQSVKDMVSTEADDSISLDGQDA